jgi:hypothetical protein
MVRASTRLPWDRLRYVFGTTWPSWLPWFIRTGLIRTGFIRTGFIRTVPNDLWWQRRPATTWSLTRNSAWNEWRGAYRPASPDGGLIYFSQIETPQQMYYDKDLFTCTYLVPALRLFSVFTDLIRTMMIMVRVQLCYGECPGSLAGCSDNDQNLEFFSNG